MNLDSGLRQRVYSIVSRIARVPADELSDDLLIRDELSIDSLLALEILAVCGRELRIEVDEAECVDLETLGEFLSYLESKGGAA
ncbi:MAG: acyl carrier protein [Spirochaetaceae bacterium]